MKDQKKPKKRPISRKFWNYLRFLPKPLQAKVVRDNFEVDYDLPSELIFKQAETEDEIRQAFRLVHDSYVELDYMDRTESELRFSIFHALATTIVLVAKIGDEVIGTISIVPDSAIGLPSDTTWDLSKYRQKGKMIAEVASLAIKKNYRMRRGKILLPLCKIMFMYCERIFKLDGIVIATTLEVEPFYLHVLLFEKVVEKTGQKHHMVKGNPSTCCYLEFNQNLKESYKKIYNKKKKSRNLYHFFVEAETPNIHLPIQREALQSYNLKKNIASSEMLKKEPSLIRDLSFTEKRVLRNLYASKAAPLGPQVYDNNSEYSRDNSRYDVRYRCWCFFSGDTQPIEGQLTDVSTKGFRMNLRDTDRKTEMSENFVVVLEFHGQMIHCSAIVKWIVLESRIGCELTGGFQNWQKIVGTIDQELHQVAFNYLKNAS